MQTGSGGTGPLAEALGAMTLRGRAFVAAGVTAAVCGVLFGERDLVRIGFLVGLLPVVTALWVARSGKQLGLSRTVSSRHLEVGQTGTVHLELSNAGRTTGVLLLEEQLPFALGSRPRFVVDAMAAGWHRSVDYPISSALRGRFEIGPLRVRLGDPFGLIELTRVFTRSATVVVTPPVEELPAVTLRGDWAGSGQDRPRAFAVGGAADVTVREYRRGDDLRRVHWRSSARVGELMVRREEQPWQASCTLLLDNRRSAHRGEGAGSSLERAVSAAASVAVHLARRGFAVRLITADGAVLAPPGAGQGHCDPRPLLEQLAVLAPSPSSDLSARWMDESLHGAMFVAVLGALAPRDRALVGRVSTLGGAPAAMLLDVDDWARRSQAPTSVAAEESVAWLQARGWRATGLERGASLPASWAGLNR